MRLSLLFGFLMLTTRTRAYFLTGSSVILADTVESVVQVIAIAFAAFRLSLSMRLKCTCSPRKPRSWNTLTGWRLSLRNACRQSLGCPSKSKKPLMGLDRCQRVLREKFHRRVGGSMKETESLHLLIEELRELRGEMLRQEAAL